MNQQSTATSESTITIDRTFDAPVAEIWQAFTDPVKLSQWWGPHNYSAKHWEIDLRPGGSFRYLMASDDGSDSNWCNGVYSLITSNSRLSSTANIENPEGPDKPVIASMNIDIQFIDKGDKTQVIVTHSGIPSALAGGAKEGWSQQFEKLDTYLPSGP
jgi:uncharacterized protein YndB with AHSA1/START domain